MALIAFPPLLVLSASLEHRGLSLLPLPQMLTRPRDKCELLSGEGWWWVVAIHRLIRKYIGRAPHASKDTLLYAADTPTEAPGSEVGHRRKPRYCPLETYSLDERPAAQL